MIRSDDFFIVGLLAVFIFYVLSYFFIKKYPQKIYYLLPAVVTTICIVIFIAFSFLKIKDGWVIMGNMFFAFFIVSGAFIGTFLPFLYMKLVKQ